MWECDSLGVTFLKQKKDERRFVDLRITLILHSRNKCLKQVLNFLKLDNIVPRYGSFIRTSF